MAPVSKNASLSATVAYKINESILRGKYSAGMKLPSETELSAQFKVSRPTIREAMKSLRAQNIITVRQGDGTYVNDTTGLVEDPLKLRYVDPEILSENIFEARLLMEPQIAMLAAERATPDEIEQLKGIAEKMQQTDYLNHDRIDLDIQFHTLIAQCSHNAIFNQLIPTIYETIEKGYIILLDSEESHHGAQNMHMRIYEAIRDKKPSLARNVMQAHVYGLITDVDYNRRKG